LGILRGEGRSLNEAKQFWLDRLGAEGAVALRDLLNGTAALGPQSAAEPEDAVAALLEMEPPDSSRVRAFDDACMELLETYRTGIFAYKAERFNVELSRLNALVSIIRRLLPSRTVVDLHQRYLLWNGFFENFVIDRSFDLRREFYRVLALSQGVGASAGLEPRRLMPLWLSICAESGGGGRYHQDYLRVALLGLRKLPLGAQFSANEDFVLHGLARWAVSQRPSEAAFEREWRIVKGDFPRTSQFWTEHVQLAVTAAERELSERSGKTTTFPLAGWWREDVDLHPQQRALIGRRVLQPVALEEWKPLLESLRSPYPSIASKLDHLMAAQRRYADFTGDVFYLVRTACNFGMRLLKTGDVGEARKRGAHAARLASLAFEYDAQNAFAWSLMRDALASAGRVVDAELVGWEAIRRFPEDVQWRNQLATLLTADAGKPEEAAALLRETVELFPAQAYSRNQLAVVLADDLGDQAGARESLARAVADGFSNDATHSLLAKLDAGRKLGAKSRRIDQSGGSSLILPTAQARRMLFQFEAGLVANSDVEAFLSDQPADAYVTYVAERTGVRDTRTNTTFALAFDEALRTGQPSALRALVARSRPIEKALVEEAIALSEGRVISFSKSGTRGAQADRLDRLELSLDQLGGAVTPSVRLLRDFAASALSSSIAVLEAA
jgi:tetratricopeptide (TPR) repeat protein